jgi:hypothetical protein
MTTWHAAAPDLATYRRGAADPLLAASVEAHLLRCAPCRRLLATLDVPGAAADSARRWRQVSDALDARLTVRESPLMRLGVSSRPLATALAISVALVLALPFVAALSDVRNAAVALLAGAPLAPMVAVAFAFRRETDPAGELSLAAPLAGIRVVTRRALLVSVVAAPTGVAGALALGLPVRDALAWLLPGLAMSCLVLLGATTRLDPAVLTAVLGAGWALGVLGTSRRDGQAMLADLVASTAVQTTSLLVAAAAIALVAVRRDRLVYRRSL